MIPRTKTFRVIAGVAIAVISAEAAWRGHFWGAVYAWIMAAALFYLAYRESGE